MSLCHRFCSFSLRTLMVVVTVCSLAAWWWSNYRYGGERRLQAALTAIWQENPRARMIVHRGEANCQVIVRDVDQVSATAARLIARSELIRRIRLRAPSDDGMLRTIRTEQSTGDALRAGYDRVFDGSFEISCERLLDPNSASPNFVSPDEDLEEWNRPIWQRHDVSYTHPSEIQRPTR